LLLRDLLGKQDEFCLQQRGGLLQLLAQHFALIQLVPQRLVLLAQELKHLLCLR
jgi:hypothetical protein